MSNNYTGGSAADHRFNRLSGRLLPLLTAYSHMEFKQRMQAGVIDTIVEFDKLLPGEMEQGSIPGFCIPCEKIASFYFDMEAGGRREGNTFFPNWRERLICSHCSMSNRQRLVATLIKQHMEDFKKRQSIYIMEKTTTLYSWLADNYAHHFIVGSEYMGPEYQGGEIINGLDLKWPLYIDNLLHRTRNFAVRHGINFIHSMLSMGGIRHEDIEKLSFPDASLDLVISNDVFEHIPSPKKGFIECARVLKPEGLMLLTIPFHINNDESIIRSSFVNGRVEHIFPPIYHGNPLSDDGSLVFTDFGWDILDDMKLAGFSDVGVEVYASAKFGHQGGGQIIFRLMK